MNTFRNKALVSISFMLDQKNKSPVPQEMGSYAASCNPGSRKGRAMGGSR